MLKVLHQLEQQTSLKVSSLDDLKKIILPIYHRETIEDLIENVNASLQKKTLM